MERYTNPWSVLILALFATFCTVGYVALRKSEPGTFGNNLGLAAGIFAIVLWVATVYYAVLVYRENDARAYAVRAYADSQSKECRERQALAELARAVDGDTDFLDRYLHGPVSDDGLLPCGVSRGWANTYINRCAAKARHWGVGAPLIAQHGKADSAERENIQALQRWLVGLGAIEPAIWARDGQASSPATVKDLAMLERVIKE